MSSALAPQAMGYPAIEWRRSSARSAESRGPRPPLRVALVGNPNAGKSTLFNALTGMRQRVANFPGVTVEHAEGSYLHDGRSISVLDLPGIYSLTPQSPDEAIAYNAVFGCANEKTNPDIVVIVVDAENLERNLFLATQVLELGRPTIIALNRVDRLEAAGLQIDIPELIHELGATVIPVVATRGIGIDHLRRAIDLAPTLPLARQPALTLEPRREFGDADAAARYGQIAAAVARCVTSTASRRHTASDRVDAFVLHRVWGPLIFLSVMALVFQAMFSWARPLMGLIQSGVTGAGTLVASAMPAGELQSLIVDGAIGGVGSVLVFLPQIAILCLFIGFLEDSGYMARAAFVMDRYMRPVGLHGKSVIPLLSGYACAVPAIMATRTINDRSQRLATIMVVPLMSCSARLPVYVLLIGAFVPAMTILRFANLQGLAMLAMYLLGSLGALGAAAVFRRTLLRAPTRALILELPPYCLPSARVLLSSVWQRVRIFLQRAGTVIFAVSIVLWALAAYPRSNTATANPEVQLTQSALGRIGHAMEPAVRPLGYDWKIGVSMVSSFAAREVFVSTMSTIYGVRTGADRAAPALQDRLRAERDRSGRATYSLAVALGLMAFYVFALMCTSTLAVTVRECGGGWAGIRWAALQFSYMLALAYGAGWVVYRVALAAGLGGT